MKLDSGVLTDAVDVLAGESGPVRRAVGLRRLVLGDVAVTTGTPIITVKANSAPVEEAPATPAVEQVEVALSDLAAHRAACCPASRARPAVAPS